MTRSVSRRRVFSPSNETLEQRVALSTASFALRPVAAMVGPARHPVVTPISGIVNGRYTIPLPEPGGSLTYTFEGNGLVSPLGQVAARGSVLVSMPFGREPIRRGPRQNQGLLTLSNSEGSLTLHLTGPVRARVVSLVNRFTVESGTGAYQGLRGRGLVMLQLNPTSVDSGGQFTLALRGIRRR
ncbi:MAG: hypothetical protein NVSMB9_21930 [Isosphaeraceae bacterium]